MSEEKTGLKLDHLSTSVLKLLNSTWIDILMKLWEMGRKAIQGMAVEGMYEVLNYESTLELQDPKGRKATFIKNKKIRYLQDNIIAYQDYGWGDGEILLNYRINQGKAVDTYRSGYKTYVLISLREVKNKGDIYDFKIQWDIRRGFLTKDGYWATDISNRTKYIQVNIIFPKSRPPFRLFLEENNRRRTRELSPEVKQQLPDGRWLVTWEKKKPRLYEIYVLRWLW